MGSVFPGVTKVIPLQSGEPGLKACVFCSIDHFLPLAELSSSLCSFCRESIPCLCSAGSFWRENWNEWNLSATPWCSFRQVLAPSHPLPPIHPMQLGLCPVKIRNGCSPCFSETCLEKNAPVSQGQTRSLLVVLH